MRRVFFGDALSGGSAWPGLLRSTFGTGGCVPLVLASLRRHRQERRAEALHARVVLVARRLVDARLVAELGVHRLDAHAVGLDAAVAAAFAHALVDDDPRFGIRLLALAAQRGAARPRIPGRGSAPSCPASWPARPALPSAGRDARPRCCPAAPRCCSDSRSSVVTITRLAPYGQQAVDEVGHRPAAHVSPGRRSSTCASCRGSCR